ncbi:alpha/beta fold hydrolase [Dictyoglomus thermophilum]|uniref:Alpha/beta fold hydrolase n=1 Tax=Dictyoglomus thermophilum TaxID=14 RepID=A0A7V3ZHW2_DICTH|nr:alpha/beta fold hydrolase [Dictyoglomus thermophilum]AOC59346.1 esterase DZ3 [synthetic construct]TYT22749.1 alpha/beta fold hydrolase [Dictyoglomus thermophilum]
MTENREPVVLKNQGQKIFGVIHIPEKTPAPFVLFCHGFTGTKIEPHRIFVKTAEALAKEGIGALRIDFRGSGDSEGSFKDMTVEGEVSDAMVAIEYLSQNNNLVDKEKIGILGLSMGGAVASITSGRNPLIKSCVLWSAVCHFDIFFNRSPEEVSRIKDYGDFIDLGGNPVGKKFLSEIVNIKPLEEIKKRSIPVLIIHGSGDMVVPIQHAYDYFNGLKDTHKVKLEIIEGADHTFNSIEWEEKVIEKTVNWFKETL